MPRKIASPIRGGFRQDGRDARYAIELQNNCQLRFKCERLARVQRPIGVSRSPVSVAQKIRTAGLSPGRSRAAVILREVELRGLRALRLLGNLAMLSHLSVLFLIDQMSGLFSQRAVLALALGPCLDNITRDLSLQLENQKNALNFSNLTHVQLALYERSAA